MSCDSRRERDLLATWRPWLRAVAAGLARDPAGVEDLAQEGWVALWRALASHRPDRAPLDWWLKQAAYRRMCDCARHGVWLGRPPRRAGSTPVRAVGEVPATGAEVFARLAADDRVEDVALAYHHGQIAAALDTLSPAQRRYVVLRFWGGLSTTELTAVYGYDPQSLWSSPRNGARGKLAAGLAHLAGAGR